MSEFDPSVDIKKAQKVLRDVRQVIDMWIVYFGSTGNRTAVEELAELRSKVYVLLKSAHQLAEERSKRVVRLVKDDCLVLVHKDPIFQMPANRACKHDPLQVASLA